MHPADIKAGLEKRGMRISVLARHLNLDISTVSHVLKGRQRSRRVEMAIAEALGLPLEKVFPNRYKGTDADG